MDLGSGSCEPLELYPEDTLVIAKHQFSPVFHRDRLIERQADIVQESAVGGAQIGYSNAAAADIDTAVESADPNILGQDQIAAGGRAANVHGRAGIAAEGSAGSGTFTLGQKDAGEILVGHDDQLLVSIGDCIIYYIAQR